VAFAHVVVAPARAGIGASTLFTVGVPNEKAVAVSSVKLTIPQGVQNVQPDVLAGWRITTTTGKNGTVTSIIWTGTIPVGQRADLVFKAQTPATVGNLDWKAYQTYADGTVVHWDQNPAQTGKTAQDDAGPYSITRVVNDLGTGTTAPGNSPRDTLALALSIAALAFSLGSLFRRRKQ
jgi:uncharacterized protein YcnI